MVCQNKKTKGKSGIFQPDWDLACRKVGVTVQQASSYFQKALHKANSQGLLFPGSLSTEL